MAGLGCGGKSRIGLGTSLSEAQSADLVRAALDLGVNFIDTAEAYGTTHIVGQAIAGRPRDGIDIVLFGSGSITHLNANIASILRRPLPPADVQKLYAMLGHLVGVGLDQPDHSASRARQQDCPIGAGMPPSFTQALTRGREPACAS